MHHSLTRIRFGFLFVSAILSTCIADAAADTFTKIDSPVVVKVTSFEGEGDDREAVIEITNKTDKTISRLGLRFIVFGKANQKLRDYSYSVDRWFGLEHKKELKKGQTFTITTRVQADSVSLAGFAKSVEWKDGEKWPVAAGPAPKQVGSTPVSVRANGMVTAGDLAAPVIEFFNHRPADIEKLEYRIDYLDKDGTVLQKGVRMRLGSGITKGTQFVHVGEEGFPEDATEIRLNLNWVNYKDGFKWKAP